MFFSFELINNTADQFHLSPEICRFDASLPGDHTKALIGQLIIFNQILGELRQDIREQVRQTEDETGRQRAVKCMQLKRLLMSPVLIR